MRYQALVPPRPWVTDHPGYCLRYAQSFFGATPAHRSAWHAWGAQQYRHSVWEPLPDVPVLLWFSHWGTYDDGLGQYGSDPNNPYYGNWGHVTPFVPGVGIYSSPANPWAGSWRDIYDTIAEVEAAYGARFVGWSEDINGLRIASPIIKEEDPMPKQTSTPSFKPNQKIPAGEWTYLYINSKKWVTFFQGDAKARSGLAHLNIAADGELDVRFVQDITSQNGSDVITSSGSVHSRINKIGIHSWPVSVKKGSEHRYRVQARPIGDEPVTVTSIRTIVDYWEKE